MTPELIRAAAIMLADKHDDASNGCRSALAEVIDEVADATNDDYLRGLAAGLRLRSRSRRIKEMPCH